MSLPHPNSFYTELVDDRLRVVAAQLLDVRYSTLQDMGSPFDDNYTRETAVFGRQRNMLIQLALGRQHDWLSLAHAGMDVTFNIGRVPCRFFTDDPKNPEKTGFFKRNPVDSLFATDDQHPVMWRFIVEKALTEQEEDRVFLVGYNVFQESVSAWMYCASTPMLHAVDRDVPTPAVLRPADVDIREDDLADNGDNAKAGNKE